MMNISGIQLTRGQHLSSMSTLMALLLTGMKQHFPKVRFNLPFNIRISYNVIYLLYIYGWWAINLVFGVEYDWRLTYSSFAGWVYLRYYMRTKKWSLRGDNRDEFSILAPLPASMRKYADPLANIVYKMSVSLGIVPDPMAALKNI